MNVAPQCELRSSVRQGNKGAGVNFGHVSGAKRP